MSAAPAEPLRVALLPKALRPAAFRRLWPQFDELGAEQLLCTYQKLAHAWGADYWSGLFGSFRGEKLTGVVWLEPQAGRIAAIHGPGVDLGEPEEVANELMKNAISHAASMRVRVVQALKSPADNRGVPALIEHGFQQTAELLFRRADCWTQPISHAPGPLRFVPYSSSTHERFVKVIEATYRGSLDCPAVDGLRSVPEVLEGYRATGVFNPERWLIATAPLETSKNDVDVGCILLAEQPLTEQWELMYMGVTPEARGRRFGLAMVRYALGMARGAGVRSMVLAVDAANQPGIALYDSAGFDTFDRRILFLRAFDHLD